LEKNSSQLFFCFSTDAAGTHPSQFTSSFTCTEKCTVGKRQMQKSRGSHLGFLFYSAWNSAG
ncbi:hypothetical protein OFN56_42275, partial [Escherichia coli]|nr:hypothetical protein [Escherichia coli]